MPITKKRSTELGEAKRKEFINNSMGFIVKDVSATLIQRYWSWNRIYETIARFKAQKRKRASR